MTLYLPQHIRQTRQTITRALAVCLDGEVDLHDVFAVARWASVEAASAGFTFLMDTEDPPKSNRGEAVAYLRAKAGNRMSSGSGDAGAWCAFAAAGAWQLGVEAVSDATGLALEITTPTSGSTARWWHKATTVGDTYLPTAGWHPKVGDVWIRSNDPRDVRSGGMGSGGHTGLVAAYNPATRMFATWEGNTDLQGTDSDGGIVACKSMSLDDERLVGFITMHVRRV